MRDDGNLHLVYTTNSSVQALEDCKHPRKLDSVGGKKFLLSFYRKFI